MSYINNLPLSLVLVSIGAVAGQDSFILGSVQFAGQIILAEPANDKKIERLGASESRKKAISSLDEVTPPAATIIIVPEEEQGVLSPSGGSAPPDNRKRAKNYLLDSETGKVPSVPRSSEGTSIGVDTPPNAAERSANKARRYLDGSSASGVKPGTTIKSGSAVGVVGTDGVVVFACDDTNNIAGRIGDDSQSGNLLTIELNGKLVKARCK